MAASLIPRYRFAKVAEEQLPEDRQDSRNRIMTPHRSQYTGGRRVYSSFPFKASNSRDNTTIWSNACRAASIPPVILRSCIAN